VTGARVVTSRAHPKLTANFNPDNVNHGPKSCSDRHNVQLGFPHDSCGPDGIFETFSLPMTFDFIDRGPWFSLVSDPLAYR